MALARAVTMYHIVVEALLAQPGQHFISDYLVKRDLLPGFREGMRLIALDEQRHIGFGVKLLHDLHVEEPAVRDAVADLIREVTPYSLAVFIPPGWDRSYTECFGFTLEEIYTEGARSFEQKLRSAGLPLESLPGPSVFPLEMSARERAEYGLAMLRAGFLGPPNGAPPRDPAAMELLFELGRARRRPPHRAGRPVRRAVGVPGRGALARARRQRLDRRGRGPRAGTSTSSCACASRTGSTSSPAASTRAARWRRVGCARTARRARCGRRAGCSISASVRAAAPICARLDRASFAEMSDHAIAVEGLEKSYGTVRALCGVDFAAPTGSILGLLGPNGAGKTTAVRILATLLEPDGGSARVAGLDVVRDAGALRAKIGLAGQYAAVDENLTGFENIEMVGQLYHLPRKEARKRARRAAGAVRARPRPADGPSRRTRAACAGGSTSPPRSSSARR